jgi:hypothetical protein
MGLQHQVEMELLRFMLARPATKPEDVINVGKRL